MQKFKFMGPAVLDFPPKNAQIFQKNRLTKYFLQTFGRFYRLKKNSPVFVEKWACNKSLLFRIFVFPNFTLLNAKCSVCCCLLLSTGVVRCMEMSVGLPQGIWVVFVDAWCSQMCLRVIWVPSPCWMEPSHYLGSIFHLSILRHQNIKMSRSQLSKNHRVMPGVCFLGSIRSKL